MYPISQLFGFGYGIIALHENRVFLEKTNLANEELWVQVL